MGRYSSSGGSGSSGRYGGGTVASAAPKKPKVKKDLSALLQGVEDMAKGFFPGMAHLAVSAYNDVDKAFGDALPGRKSSSYMLDDVGKAIAADYKTRYGDLFDGDIDGFVNQLRTRPLDFILDAATIVTLGGSGVTAGGRAVLSGAKAGAASSKLVKWAGYVPRTADNLADAIKVYGANSRQVRRGADAGVVRGVRRTPMTLRNGERAGEDLLGRLHENPVLRRRDRVVREGMKAVPGMRHVPLVNQIGGVDSARMSAVPILGTQSRIARRDRKRPVLAEDVLKHELTDRPAHALAKLSPDEQKAWNFKHQGIDPREFAAELQARIDEGRLSPEEALLGEATIAEVTAPKVLAAFDAPSERLLEAVDATQELASDKMGQLLVDMGILSERQLLERRLLPQQVIAAGGVRATHHPTATVAAPNAKYWARKAKQMARARERRATRVEERAAALAAKLEADGVLPAGVFDAATNDVDVAALRKLLKDARYLEAIRTLREQLIAYYNLHTYGTANPSEAQVRAMAVRAAAAKRRSKGKKTRERQVSHQMLENAVRKYGAWSRQATRIAEEGGFPDRLREARTRISTPKPMEARFQTPDALLMQKGIHPDDPFSNVPADYDVAADVIEQWLNEGLDGVQVRDIAIGGAPNMEGAGDTGGSNLLDNLDVEGSQELIAEARRLNPDLPRDPDNQDIAQALARRYVNTPEDAVTIPRKEWVRRMQDAILRVHTGDELVPLERAGGAPADHRVALDDSGSFGADAGAHLSDDAIDAELFGTGPAKAKAAPDAPDTAAADLYGMDDATLGGVREVQQLATHDLETRLGVRDDLLGLEPSAEGWVDAIRKIARDAGLDDDYRDAVRMLANAESMRRAREVQKMQKRAALIREQKSKRQLAAEEKAVATVPMKLDGADAPLPPELEGVPGARPGKYGKDEIVNPETGALFRDENLATPVDDLRDAAEGAAYFPHHPAKQSRKGGTARVNGSVKRPPTLASNYTHRSTGRAFEHGTYDMHAMQLLEEATKLARTKLAHDLYDVAVNERSIPFDDDVYRRTGGSDTWVLLDTANVNNLGKIMDREGQIINQAAGLLEGESFDRFLVNLGESKEMNARVLAEAQAGNIRMVPRVYYNALTGDLRQSGKIARWLVDKPLDVFRALTLFARPAYYVNNVVGQHLILAVRQKGPGFIPAYIKFLSTTGRQSAARSLFHKAATDPSMGAAMWRDVLDAYAPELKGASVYDVEVRPGMESVATRWRMGSSKAKRMMARVLQLPNGAARVGAILSDDLPRQFHFIRLMQKHVKAARKDGVPGSDAEVAMRLLEGDTTLRENIIEQVLSDLIDYRGMSHMERQVVRRIIPFYGWLRGITFWTAELGYNHPASLYVLAQIGALGDRENAEWAENVPGYLAGSIRVGDEKDGKQTVLNTQGLNPFATVGDVTKMFEALVSVDPRASLATSTIAGQLNPYARAGLQSLFNQGRDFTTQLPMGTPWSTLNAEGSEQAVPGGILGSTLLGVAGGLPQPMLYRRWATINSNMDRYGTPGSPQSVNSSPMSDYWWSYAGLPMRQVNIAAARTRRSRDEAILAGEAM